MATRRTADQLRAVWPSRLKAARSQAALSQRALGVAAGLDESVASVRINRYEQGVHSPDYVISCRLAEALRVPVAYLYCDDEELAELLVRLYRAGPSTISSVRRRLAGMKGGAP